MSGITINGVDPHATTAPGFSVGGCSLPANFTGDGLPSSYPVESQNCGVYWPPYSYPAYWPYAIPAVPDAPQLGLWKVVGHCHKCGNPIYAMASTNAMNPPDTRRSCECKS